jgi:hypothetical protein
MAFFMSNGRARPGLGEEVMAMDEANVDSTDVDVTVVSINRTSDLSERMGENEY